jgi:uncharacterized protein (TIGR01244 family)
MIRLFCRAVGSLLMMCAAAGFAAEETGPGAASADNAALAKQTLQVGPGVTLAGALLPDAVRHLAATGALVLDLRGASEGADTEARAMALAGVDYVHLPQTAAPPAPADVAFLRDLLAVNNHRGVVIHCASGNRAALLWGAYRLDQGAALPDVLEQVRPIATKQATRQGIATYAASRQAPAGNGGSADQGHRP